MPGGKESVSVSTVSDRNALRRVWWIDIIPGDVRSSMNAFTNQIISVSTNLITYQQPENRKLSYSHPPASRNSRLEYTTS